MLVVTPIIVFVAGSDVCSAAEALKYSIAAVQLRKRLAVMAYPACPDGGEPKAMQMPTPLKRLLTRLASPVNAPFGSTKKA